MPTPAKKNATHEDLYTIPENMIGEIMSRMPKYAQAGVPFLWMIDPTHKTLDIFQLASGEWVLSSTHVEDDKVRTEPFQELELDLALLWAT